MTTLEFLQSAGSAGNNTVYTFSSQNLGAANINRYIVVATGGTTVAGVTISSITVGGITADIIRQRTTTAGGSEKAFAGIAIAHVPTGTSGDIVVTLTSGGFRCGIYAYRAIKVLNGAEFDDDDAINNPLSGTLSVPNKGAIVSVAYGGGEGDDGGITWTGLTEDGTRDLEAHRYLSGASAANLALDNSYSFEADWDAPRTDFPLMVSASFEFESAGGSPIFFGAGF